MSSCETGHKSYVHTKRMCYSRVCVLCNADKCTNVLSQSEDWEAIVGFCDRINKDPDGPQTALKLLVHKMQSPQEKESLLALTVSCLPTYVF